MKDRRRRDRARNAGATSAREPGLRRACWQGSYGRPPARAQLCLESTGGYDSARHPNSVNAGCAGCANGIGRRRLTRLSGEGVSRAELGPALSGPWSSSRATWPAARSPAARAGRGTASRGHGPAEDRAGAPQAAPRPRFACRATWPAAWRACEAARASRAPPAEDRAGPVRAAPRTSGSTGHATGNPSVHEQRRARGQPRTAPGRCRQHAEHGQHCSSPSTGPPEDRARAAPRAARATPRAAPRPRAARRARASRAPPAAAAGPAEDRARGAWPAAAPDRGDRRTLASRPGRRGAAPRPRLHAGSTGQAAAGSSPAASSSPSTSQPRTAPGRRCRQLLDHGQHAERGQHGPLLGPRFACRATWPAAWPAWTAPGPRAARRPRRHGQHGQAAAASSSTAGSSPGRGPRAGAAGSSSTAGQHAEHGQLLDRGKTRYGQGAPRISLSPPLTGSYSIISWRAWGRRDGLSPRAERTSAR